MAFWWLFIFSDLPYLCDIQLFENIKNANLLAHIERMGFVFYGGDKWKKAKTFGGKNLPFPFF
jgi:hypothetical protein